MDFTELTRSELFTLIMKQKTSLFNMKVGPTRTSDERIKEAQADIKKMLNALKLATTTTPSAAQKTYNYGQIMLQQSLCDVIEPKKPFIPGNDVNQFITVLNKAYIINVIPELATYPSLEAEFANSAKDLLDPGIFQQIPSRTHPSSNRWKATL